MIGRHPHSRALINCTQARNAYVVELEAWERIDAPMCASVSDPVNPGGSPYVGDDNSASSITTDADRFWWKYYAPADVMTGCASGSNGVSDDVDYINCILSNNTLYPPNSTASIWWDLSAKAAALVQMYDLLAPVDFPRALVYLERLRQMSNAFLAYRDDKRPEQYLVDQYHSNLLGYNVVMPAWGSVGGPDDGPWNGAWFAQTDMSALFAYPMAAFARRVVDQPDAFCMQYRQDAISFIKAVNETYAGFRVDMATDSAHPEFGYYWGLDRTGAAPFNVTLSALRPMVENARAADSDLYRGSATGQNDSFGIYYATQEGPQFIAKNIAYFVYQSHQETLDGGSTTWRWWRYAPAYSDGQYPEDINHSGFTVSALIKIWENRSVLDGLLSQYGYSERVYGPTGLNEAFMHDISNTFLRRLWYCDYIPGSSACNLITKRIDGPNSGLYSSNAPIPQPGLATDGVTPLYGNAESAGFVGLAQFDPWVWGRARDSVFKLDLSPPAGCWKCDSTYKALWLNNYAALLRYRSFW